MALTSFSEIQDRTRFTVDSYSSSDSSPEVSDCKRRAAARSAYSFGIPQTAAPSMVRSPISSPELLRCKRRVNFGGLGYALPSPQPQTVARRNERERNRVKMVNMGFVTLRNHVPMGAKNKKLSKVDTLRSAVDYIKQLQQLLHDPSGSSSAIRDNSDLGTDSSDSQENYNPLSSLGATDSRSPSPCASVDSHCGSLSEGPGSSSTLSSEPSPYKPNFESNESASPIVPSSSYATEWRQLSDQDLVEFSTWFS